MTIQVVLGPLPEDPEGRYTVTKRDLATIKQDADSATAVAAEQLRTLFAFHVRPVARQRSPKRRSPDDDGTTMCVLLFSALRYQAGLMWRSAGLHTRVSDRGCLSLPTSARCSQMVR
jgi:hypothetical protein